MMNVKFFLFPLTLLLVTLLAAPLSAEAYATTSDSTQQDSIPRIEYIGYRLYLTHFEVVKKKKDWLYIKLSAINTGNKNMILGRGASQIFPVAKFDPSFDQAGLTAYQSAIYFQLLEENITIPIGAITTNIELKIPLTPEPEELAVKAAPIQEAATPIEETVEEVAVLESTFTASKKSEESPPTESVTNSEPMTTPSITTASSTDEAMPSPSVEETEEMENACSDLVLQNIKVLKRSKKSLTLQYELYNQGLGKAPLIIGKKKDQQSLAIRANLSSSEKLTRGAIVLGGTFLHGDEMTLAGGQSYTGTIKIELYKLTKFTPILILELDAYEFVKECDEGNNKNTLRLLEEEEQ